MSILIVLSCGVTAGENYNNIDRNQRWIILTLLTEALVFTVIVRNPTSATLTSIAIPPIQSCFWRQIAMISIIIISVWDCDRQQKLIFSYFFQTLQQSNLYSSFYSLGLTPSLQKYSTSSTPITFTYLNKQLKLQKKRIPILSNLKKYSVKEHFKIFELLEQYGIYGMNTYETILTVNNNLGKYKELHKL